MLRNASQGFWNMPIFLWSSISYTRHPFTTIWKSKAWFQISFDFLKILQNWLSQHFAATSKRANFFLNGCLVYKTPIYNTMDIQSLVPNFLWFFENSSKLTLAALRRDFQTCQFFCKCVSRIHDTHLQQYGHPKLSSKFSLIFWKFFKIDSCNASQGLPNVPKNL